MACYSGVNSGILPVDKPAGFTSFDVIAKTRGLARTRKIGHAGTLDPMATGVLPLFFGRAAKAVDLLPDHDKTYIAEFRLGITTATFDTTGEILETRPFSHITASDIERELTRFVGEQLQTPPMYSAVKVNGKRLYDLARKGIEAHREPRPVTVYSVELLSPNSFEISCSRGTYIRSICHDLGQRLGCGAAMSALRRTKACGYTLKDCVRLEDITPGTPLLPVESAFMDLPAFTLDAARTARFLNGLHLKLEQFDSVPAGRLRIRDTAGRFLGLAEADENTRTLRIIKLFSLGEV